MIFTVVAEMHVIFMDIVIFKQELLKFLQSVEISISGSGI